MNKPAAVLALGVLGLVLYSRRAAAMSAPLEDIAPDTVGSSSDILQSITEWGATVTTGQTRGERNNNPGNLRHGIAWLGLAEPQSDPDFATFVTPDYGLRALALNLRNYQLFHGLNTVRGIVTRWAPPSENNTGAYINAVSSAMGVGPDAPLNLLDFATLEALTAAIVQHENGRVIYEPALLSQAVDSALAA